MEQLIGSSYGIVDLGYYLQYQILRQGTHSGPVLDIGTELDLYALVCHTVGIEDTVLVNIAIEMIFVFSEISIEVRCGSQHTLVGAVAAMERASIRATEAIWPFCSLEPSRFGKFLVE